MLSPKGIIAPRRPLITGFTRLKSAKETATCVIRFVAQAMPPQEPHPHKHTWIRLSSYVALVHRVVSHSSFCPISQ